MRVQVLGPVRVFDDRAGDRPVDLRGPRNRALVARLALDAGTPVAPATLIEDLWGADVPADAVNALQSIVSRTRRQLPDGGCLESTSAGYLLHARVDAAEFAELVAAGRLVEARARWAGRALADVRDFPFAEAAATRLELARLDAVERELAARRPDAATAAELAELTRLHPYREGLWGLYLEALARTGRPAEALTAYQELRHRLAEELGTDPSPEVAALHARILRGELSAAPEPGAAAPAAPGPTPASSAAAAAPVVAVAGRPSAEGRPSAQGRAARLPAALTSFVGREKAVDEVLAALDEHRLVTLLGPGGAGKTRLAVESARAGVFTEVWLTELASVTEPDDVVAAITAGLGLLGVSVLDRSRGPRPVPGHERERLLGAVADLDGLLVVDNCEHLVDAVAAVVDQVLARAPGLRVLATSREPLRIIGECAYPVTPLEVPAPTRPLAEAARCSAIQLFAERARAVERGFTLDEATLPAVREICARLDGQPLAIELAAARLRTLTAEQIAERLSDRFRLLTGGSRSALPRHRTLRAVVEWSWDLLDPAERDLADRISVFPGGVTATGAAAVLDTAADVEDLLASLAEKSLLVPVRAAGEPGEPRFRMLETLREFGADRLVERGVAEQVRRRHLAHFVALAVGNADRVRGAGQVAAMARFEAERGNLSAALRYAVESGDRPSATSLVAAQCWFWAIRNQSQEAVGWVRAALALPGSGAPAAEIACAAIAIAISAATGDPDVEGREALVARILELWDAHRPDDHFSIVVMAGLAHYGRLGGRVPPAPRDAWTRAMIGIMTLALAENAGRLSGDQPELETVIGAFRDCGDLWGLAMSLGMRATLEANQGRFAQARATWHEALPLLERLGADEDAAMGRMRMLSLEVCVPDPDPAAVAALRRELLQQVAAADRQGFAPAAMMARFGLAQVAWVAGDAAAAAAELAGLLAERTGGEVFGGEQFEAMMRGAHAVALAALDERERAGQELATAIRTALGSADLPVAAGVAVAAAQLVHRAGNPERAARLLGVAVALRGREDLSNRDALLLERRLRQELGEPGFEHHRTAGLGLEQAEARRELEQVAADPPR